MVRMMNTAHTVSNIKHRRLPDDFVSCAIHKMDTSGFWSVDTLERTNGLELANRVACEASEPYGLEWTPEGQEAALTWAPWWNDEDIYNNLVIPGLRD